MARGRGIDFEHRFKTSRWAEDVLLAELNRQKKWIAVRFGLSEVQSPESLGRYNKTNEKEPDLLVLDRRHLNQKQISLIEKVNSEKADRVALFVNGELAFLLGKAFVAIEVEFSPYKASEMKGRGWKKRTEAQWDKRPLKHANPPVAPNIFVKEEDLSPLLAWQKRNKIPIVVTHVFDQEAFAISLDQIQEFETSFASLQAEAQRGLQVTTGIFKKIQTYDRVDAQGAVEKKAVYCVSPAASVKSADIKNVQVKAQLGVSPSGKYVSHVIFEGGKVSLTPEYLELLEGRIK
jgi:hypothetical protein